LLLYVFFHVFYYTLKNMFFNGFYLLINVFIIYAKKCPRRLGFFSAIRDDFSKFTTADFRQIWPWHVNRGWNADFGQKFMKNYNSGVIYPNTWRGSNRHLTHSRLQVKGCTAERYCLLHVVVQRPESFQVWSTFFVWRTVVNFFCMTYGCGATGRQNCPIFEFWPIFPYKMPK